MPPPASRGALSVLLLNAHGQRARAAGSDNCPCLTSSPLSSYIVGGNLVFEGHTWPADFGIKQCKGHESGLPPHCQDLRGTQPPAWCESPWCYVDPQNCAGETFERSIFFTNAQDAYFSYTTCGSSNTFTQWASDSLGTHELTEVVDLMKGYVCSIQQALEDALENELQSGGCGTGSPLEGTCPCGDACVAQASWGQCVDFKTTRSTISLGSRVAVSDLTKCVGKTAAAYFGRIAGKEHIIKSRIAYAYMGTQSDGHMTQYPGTEWCPQDYDPRFRGWYATAASGPKDVVIVLDMSGSMSIEYSGKTRAALAKEAAVAVLKTLTDADFIAVVAFGTCAAAYSDTPVRATTENRYRVEQWIEELNLGGQTGFVAALDLAFDVFKNGHSKSQWTRCPGSAVVLFLSDGDPTDKAPAWTDAGGAGRLTWLQNRNKDAFNNLPGFPNDPNRVASIMTYTLGSGISADGKDVMKMIACGNRGAYEHVPEGGALKDVMASYYHIFSSGARYSSRQTCSIRWILYEDALSCAWLLGACAAIHDFSSLSEAEKQADKEGELFGAVCIDANMVAPLDGDNGLRAHPGWNDFNREVEAEQRRCSAPPSDDAITATRARVGMGSCPATPVSSAAPGDAVRCGEYDPPNPLRVNYLPYGCTRTADMSLCAESVAADDGGGGGSGTGVIVGVIVAVIFVLCAIVGYRYVTKQKSQPKQPGPPPGGENQYAAPAIAPPPAAGAMPLKPGGRGGSATPPQRTPRRAPGGVNMARDMRAGAAHMVPPDWDTAARPPPRGYAVVPIDDPQMLRGLQNCLITRPDELGKGQDVREKGSYSKLTVVSAWRIEHHTLWQKYKLARDEVETQMSHLPHHGSRVPLYNSRGALQHQLRCWADELGEALHYGVNEALVAHATKPEVIPSIIASGLSEKYSGGLFGHGAYLAEDCGKCDQYVTLDKGAAQNPALADLLYRKPPAPHRPRPHPGNMYYVFICRVTLGVVARTKDGRTSLDNKGQVVWADGSMRELCMIPNSQPLIPYHSLLAELGHKVLRYREIMMFHCERIYPLYLVAYRRTK